MTAQYAEELIYQGESHSMCTNPLSDYFALSGVKLDSSKVLCTALWRGYLGTWEIVDNRLYLIKLVGANTVFGGPEFRLPGDDTVLEDNVSLAIVFPDYPDRVFAHWFSGTIRLPQGELLHYIHSGYRSIYERDLFLHLENGVVNGSRVIQNGVAGDGDPYDEEYFFKMMATLHPKKSAQDPVFAVTREDLIAQVSRGEIEVKEVVTDPLNTVPPLPFGHLNPAWLHFLESVQPTDKLWSFQAEWTDALRTELRQGYVAVHEDGGIGPWFITSIKDVYDPTSA